MLGQANQVTKYNFKWNILTLTKKNMYYLKYWINYDYETYDHGDDQHCAALSNYLHHLPHLIRSNSYRLHHLLPSHHSRLLDPPSLYKHRHLKLFLYVQFNLYLCSNIGQSQQLLQKIQTFVSCNYALLTSRSPIQIYQQLHLIIFYSFYNYQKRILITHLCKMIGKIANKKRQFGHK